MADGFAVREIMENELEPLLEIYWHLQQNPMPVLDERVTGIWREILADKNHHVIVGVLDGALVSSCVAVVVPNLTRGQRPYMLIENVVTHEAHRKKGYASAVLDYAQQTARRKNCYKIMLLTGVKEESTLRFYERAGFNRRDKTAFVQWLP